MPFIVATYIYASSQGQHTHRMGGWRNYLPYEYFKVRHFKVNLTQRNTGLYLIKSAMPNYKLKLETYNAGDSFMALNAAEFLRTIRIVLNKIINNNVFKMAEKLELLSLADKCEKTPLMVEWNLMNSV